MPANARNDLAAQQSRLVGALTTGTAPPGGFDPAQLETAARALAAKRSRSAAKAWPRLAESLEGQFEKLFADYASEARLPPGAEPRDDGRAFGCWLGRRGLLPDCARLEMAVDAVARGFPFRIVFLPNSRRLTLLFRGLGRGVSVLGRGGE